MEKTRSTKDRLSISHTQHRAISTSDLSCSECFTFIVHLSIERIKPKPNLEEKNARKEEDSTRTRFVRKKFKTHALSPFPYLVARFYIPSRDKQKSAYCAIRRGSVQDHERLDGEVISRASHVGVIDRRLRRRFRTFPFSRRVYTVSARKHSHKQLLDETTSRARVSFTPLYPFSPSTLVSSSRIYRSVPQKNIRTARISSRFHGQRA